MRRITMDARPGALGLMVCALVACGCAGLPRIDPSGERFFIFPSDSTAPAYQPLPTAPSYQPLPAAPAYQLGSTAPPYQPGAAGAPLQLTPSVGPRQPGAALPGYRQGLAAGGYRDVPGPSPFRDAADLLLCPQTTVAPVGTEVVLLASVRGSDQYLRTNQRVEWTIAPGGVGQFVDLGKNTPIDWLLWDFNHPRKINSTEAIGSTSRSHLRLTRGTATPLDDVCVLPGQAWITITSPSEGISYVTAYSPCVAGWASRRETAVIHWIDAQWTFPPPAINTAGSRHVLTTTVTRHTDQSPRRNWLVRYEILSGPAAGFAPDGAQMVEVPTDASGRASVEIFQQQPVPGTNQVGIQVIRPAPADGSPGVRLVVGTGTTMKTWSSPDITLRKTGPAVAAVGATLTYRIEVSNPGDLPAEDVLVTDEIPQGLTYLRSDPAGEVTGRTIRWRLGTLSPARPQLLKVECRAERQGSVTNCAEATAAGGLQARGCMTTTVAVPALDVKVTRIDPAGRVTVGDEVTFEIVVTNRGQLPAQGLLIKDRFDPGLEHAEAPSPIEKELGVDLPPGQSQTVWVAFRVTRAGEVCHTVEVLGAGAVLASARACVTAVEPTPTQPAIEPGREAEPGIGPQPPSRPLGPADVSLTVEVDGARLRTVGETAKFTMDALNKTTRPLRNLKLVAELDRSLIANRATDGYQFEGEALFWTIDTLEPGRKARFELEVRCEVPSDRARNRVRLVADGRTVAEAEASLNVRPTPDRAPADLDVTMNANREPVHEGKEVTYLIKVSNNGPRPHNQVVLEVTLPAEMVLVMLETIGPRGGTYEIVRDDFTRRGQTIRFHPVDQIQPQETLEYRVSAKAMQPGEVLLQARLTTETAPSPIAAEARTTIEPAR